MSDLQLFMTGAWFGALVVVIAMIVAALCYIVSRIDGPTP